MFSFRPSLTNAVLDGADAVILSGETSVGGYPIGAVQTMARIITSTEAHGLERTPSLGNAPKTRGGAITLGAVEIAHQLRAHSICTFTQSGDSARRLFRLRPTRPLYAFTPTEDVRNQLTLAWGIHPLLAPAPAHTDEMTAHIDAVLLDEGLAASGDLVVMVAGAPPGIPGSTNLIKLHQVGEQSGPVRVSSRYSESPTKTAVGDDRKA